MKQWKRMSCLKGKAWFSLFVSLLVVFSSASACSPAKTTDLEIARNKLRSVENKIANMTEGAWIPLPSNVFQPSIKSILDDLDSLNYAPPRSPANDLIMLAKSYMLANDFNKAFTTFQQASGLDQGNPEPYFWMGLLLPATGGPPEVALWSLGEAINKDASQQKLIAMFALRQRGILDLMTRDPESASNDFTDCISVGGTKQQANPVFWQTVYVNRGIAYQQMAKTSQALQDYERALDLASLEENPLIVKKIQELLDEIDKAIK